MVIDADSVYSYIDGMLKDTVYNNPYIPIIPHVKQAIFLACMHEEVLYGGAAGGGKSAAILMHALQRIQSPNYRSLVMRRRYPDLIQPNGLIDVAHEWLQTTDAVWNEQKKTWYFPNNCQLVFKHCNSENDKYNVQGGEYQSIDIDEAGQFTETQISYISSRLRRDKNVSVKPTIRLSANPGGVGHEYLKKRYIASKNPEWIFIPAVLMDNPSLNGEEYRKQLEKLDYVTRERLLNGNWEVMPGGNMFRYEWFNFVESVPPDYSCAVRYWDMAATVASTENPDPDWTVGTRMVKLLNGKYTVTDVRRFRCSPLETENRIKKTAEIDGKDTRIIIEEEPGSEGISLVDHYKRNILSGFYVSGKRSTGDKVLRAQPYSAAVEHGEVSLVSSQWNHNYIDELSIFPGEEGTHDDQVDSSSGAFAAIKGLSVGSSRSLVVGTNRDFVLERKFR